jgi:hypothetical protein
MSISNKIPSNNSVVDVKTNHNEMIDNQNKHGFVNLIANGDFHNLVEVDDIIDIIDIGGSVTD